MVGKSGHVIIGKGDYHLDWVHVDNVASAHVLAEQALRSKPKTVSGQIYNIGSSMSKGDAPVFTHGELVGEGPAGTLDHWGQPRPSHLPVTLVMLLGFINELLWLLFGTPFDEVLSRTTLLYTQRTYYFDSSKAARDLGYRVLVPVKEGKSLLRTHCSHV